MTYTEAHRLATLRYRRKNADKLREANHKYVTKSREKWATYYAETKSFRAIDYS